MSEVSHLDTIGPDYHAEMEEQYATGRDLSEALMRVEELEAENFRLRMLATAVRNCVDDYGITDHGTMKRAWFFSATGLDEPVGLLPWRILRDYARQKGADI